MRPTDQSDPADELTRIASLLAAGFLRLAKRRREEAAAIRLEAVRDSSLNNHAGLRREEEENA